MAHRWTAPKVSKWEARRAQWDLSLQDGLSFYLARLPTPIKPAEHHHIKNTKGGKAEMWKLTYVDVQTPDDELLYHGTTYLGLADILSQGLRPSSDPAVHEFTVPGIYCADRRSCSLYYHATATRFTGEDCPEDTPYVRFVLRVQPLTRATKTSSP